MSFDAQKVPNGWEIVTVGGIADSIQYGHTASAVDRETGPRFLRITDIQDGQVHWGSVPSCNLTDEELPKYQLKPGDLVFARTGATTGKSFLIRLCPDAVFASYLIRVRVSREIDERFLALFFQSPEYWRQIEGGKRGVGQPNVNGTILGQVRFILPPLAEQRRIVEKLEELFSELDAGVANLKKARAQLAVYRQALLKHAFEGKLTAEWRAKHAAELESAEQLLAHIGAERRQLWEEKQIKSFTEAGKTPPKDWNTKYKEPHGPAPTKLPPLPSSWCWATVEQLSTKVVDGVHKKPNYVKEGVPFVTVRNLTAGSGISFERLNYITSDDHAEFIKRANPERDDILISKDGTLGVIRAVSCDTVFSIFVSVALVKPVRTRLSRYFTLALTAPQVQIQMVPKGSGLAHIHLEDLRQDCIPLAPLSEQDVIVEMVERQLSAIGVVEADINLNLQKAEALRQSILKKAFAGELVPQDPADEPAAALLTRICAEREAQAAAPKLPKTRTKKA